MKRAILLFALVAMVSPLAQLNAQQKTIAQTAIDAGNFNTLVTAAKAAGLVDTLNGNSMLTVFAPTDEAFAQVDPATLEMLLKPENKDKLTAVLTYHVVAGRVAAKDAYDLNSAGTVSGQRLSIDFRGDGLRVGDANIVVTDIQCSNGIIHVIDAVLIPQLTSIPQTAEAAGSFNTLLAAVGAAGLGEVLSGPGPFTVFAPTDEAFAALPAGTVETLLKPENKQQLVDILKYHVISGRVYANDGVKAGNATTLLGRGLDVMLNADGIKVNESSVLAKNIEATNGVIHVIDSVLIPTSMTRQAVMAKLASTVTEASAVYNSGDHGECSKMYTNAMQSIMSAGIANADEHTMTMIDGVLRDAQNTHGTTERAWVLRRGIDQLYLRVSSMPEMSTEVAPSGSSGR